jgi:hypothetical protein
VHPQVARAGGTHTHRSERGSDVAGHVAAAGRLVVVVDALELEVGVAVVGAGRVNAVLMPCSLETTSQNLAPIWLPHWPPWIATSLTHLCCVILKRAARGRRGGEAVRQVATDDGGRGISPAPAELEQHKVAHRRACDVCTRKPQRRWSQSGILRAGEIIFNRDSGAESRKGLGRRVRWSRSRLQQRLHRGESCWVRCRSGCCLITPRVLQRRSTHSEQAAHGAETAVP